MQRNRRFQMPSRWLLSVSTAVAMSGALLLSSPAYGQRTVSDMAGRRVTIADTVHRVYAVGHCLPIVAAVAPEMLVNSYRLSDAAKRFLPPDFYRDKATPAAGARFSDEEIVAMRPDLVVMEAAPGVTDQAARLEARLHVPVVLVDQDIRKYKEAFIFLGELLDRKAQAGTLVDFVHIYLDPVGEKARSIPAATRRKVYYAEGPDGLSTNPSGSAHSQILDFIGAENVAKVDNLPGEGMSAVSLEQLYLWQPELILVWTPAADRLTTWRAITGNPLWRRLDAVRTGHVVQIPWLPFSWFDRPPGTNRILGVLWLAQLLYPETFTFDMVDVTREYFKKFYHHELSRSDARYLLALAHPEGQGGQLDAK